MAFAPAPGVAEFACKYTSYGNEQLNVHHVMHTDGSAWTAAQLQAMCTVIANWDNSTLAATRVTDFTLIQVLGKDLSTQNGAEFPFGALSAGTNGGGALPENVTIAIKKVSGLSGRGFRGRVYHIGVPRTQVSQDSVSSGFQATLVNAYNALITAVNAVTNCQYCILRSRHNGVALNPRVGLAITSFTVTDGYVDSQRRRLAGHNVHR